jgi:hypothetical protein
MVLKYLDLDWAPGKFLETDLTVINSTSFIEITLKISFRNMGK